MAAKRGLLARYKAFADEYLRNGGNAYRAALAAGYRETTAHAKSYQLLEREDVAAYIDMRRQQMAKRAVTPERVLLELAAIGFADVTDYVTIANGKVQVADTDQMDSTARRALSVIKESRDGVEIRLADKVKALELMGKNLGLFERGKTVEDDTLKKAAELLGGIDGAIE